MVEDELRATLARIEIELAELEAKLADQAYRARTVQQRLDDETQARNELRAQVVALREQLARVPISGGLPADGVGRWAPLTMFERDEPTTEPPIPPLDVTPADAPDYDDLSREVTALFRDDSLARVDGLARLARRWRHDPRALRLLVAGLRSCRHPRRAELFAAPLRPVPTLPTALPPTPLLTMATELPNEFDGLTRSQRRVLEVMADFAPPGRPFLRLTEIAAEMTLRDAQFDLTRVERTLLSLGHPSLRRVPLVELQGLTNRFAPHDMHATHARLTSDGLAYLRGELALPLLLVNGAEGRGACVPPHSPSELLGACLYLLEAPHGTLEDLRHRLLQGLDFPDGGSVSAAGRLWGFKTGRVTRRPKYTVELDDESGRGRVVVSAFPWPLTVRDVLPGLEGLRAKGHLDGVTGIVDSSSSTAQRLEISVEHVAFGALVRDQIIASQCVEQTLDVALLVDGQPPRQVDLVELLRSFIEHRKEHAVKKLDRALAEAHQRAAKAEAVYVAVRLLEPVLAATRAAIDDAEAVAGLLDFIKPEHRERLAQTPFPLSHRYARGFTEAQAKHVVSIRKLTARRLESAQQDWATTLSACDEAKARLSNRQDILEVVREELRAARARFDLPRLTTVMA